jgi:hypothetical protein
MLYELNEYEEYGRAALNADSALMAWEKRRISNSE